jgi:hypothetical protein
VGRGPALHITTTVYIHTTGRAQHQLGIPVSQDFFLDFELARLEDIKGRMAKGDHLFFTPTSSLIYNSEKQTRSFLLFYL